MKRKRISNEVMERAIQKQLPNFKLVDCYRPDGEYIFNSRFVFQRTDNSRHFPNKFTLVDMATDEEFTDFQFEYESNEDRKLHGEDLFNVIQFAKTAVWEYSGYLDINQTMEVINRYIKEVFTQSYIEKHQAYLEGGAKAIAYAMHSTQDENGLIKAGTLYRRLEEDMNWEPVRHVENHFAYTFPYYNPFVKDRDSVLIGGIFSVQLPLRSDSDFGGGVKRPCVIVGKSSRNYYYVLPMTHVKYEDNINKEYFVCKDKEGRDCYAMEGIIDCVSENCIFEYVDRLDVKTFNRICNVISRENKIRPSIYDFMIGMGGATKDDLLKVQVNAYDNQFKFPKDEDLYSIIAKVLTTEEKITKKEIYKKVAGDILEFDVQHNQGNIIFHFPRIDGKIKIVKFVIDQPIDVLSNHKQIVKGAENLSRLAPDKMLADSYRFYMTRKYPFFKFMLIKRLVLFLSGVYQRQRFKGEDTLKENAEYLKRHLEEARLAYDGDLETLVAGGIEKIELDKLHTIKPEVPVKAPKPQQPKQEDEEEMDL